MADSLTFEVHPQALMKGLRNALVVSEEKTQMGPDVIRIEYAGTGMGQVRVMGMGRFSGGITTIDLETGEPEYGTWVCISREDADSLAKALSGMGVAKATRARLVIPDQGQLVQYPNEDGTDIIEGYINLFVYSGSELIAELEDADVDGLWDSAFAFLERMTEWQPPEPGVGQDLLAFPIECLAKIAKIKSDSLIVDFGRTTHPRVWSIAVGSNFRGVLGDSDREDYANGYGSPSHLITHPASSLAAPANASELDDELVSD